MADYIPTFQLYQSNGTSLVYAFTKMQNINDFQDPSFFVEHTSLRGVGSIIIPDSNTQGVNGNAPWDMELSFYLLGTDYSDLVAQINTLKTTVNKFTKYYLKVQLTLAGATQNYKVIRLESFDFPISNPTKRTKIQITTAKFRVNGWQ